MSADRPIRVAIVGGGCASMAAAFELTRPEQLGRFQVTVYQQGFRLGGKGASGRGAADRIEEHGLHLWMGFYENAFRLMRECYAELGRDPERCPIADWRDAFAPDPYTGVAERLPTGGWSVWRAHLPPADGLPGDPWPAGRRFSVADYMSKAAALLRTLFESLQVRTASGEASGPRDAAELPQEQLARLLRFGELATLSALIEAANLLGSLLAGLPQQPDNLLLRFVDAIGRNARDQLSARVDADPELRRLWTVADLTLATLRGMLRFGLATHPRGFEAIDDYDCREWLQLNGASPSSLDSGYLRGLYDLGFSYEDGDPQRPRIAAGQALRSMLRAFFTYRGAFFWKMQAGMGDAVFAPLYEVLHRRGVRFAFFHKLLRVGLAEPVAGERPHVSELEFAVQATVRGEAEYEPLVNVAGLPSWPAAPRFEQLVGGDRLRDEGWDFESFWDERSVDRLRLRVLDDFDFVVLGTGVGAIPFVCRELVQRDPRWRAMVDHVKTVATQAFQLWLRVDRKELGWTDPPINVSGFVKPFDTWADMGHLIPRESWREPPLSLAYFCSALPDAAASAPPTSPEYPRRMRDYVRANAIRFLERDVRHLWPKSSAPEGSFRWDWVAAPDGSRGAGPQIFDTQFWTANVNPSDRYALSLPGSLRYRISPLDASYENLTIAGDWTDCGFNAGCVEAAVMSGRLAAHALSGAPALSEIVGFDHP